MSEHLPFRAVGGNVLLRRVKQDGMLLTVEGFDSRVLQLAEVVGLGSRWNQDRKWLPPMPTQSKERSRTLIDGTQDPDWKPMWRYPDSSTPRPPPVVFTEGHRARIEDLSIGDLVVYVTSRVYDHFQWREHDILVYPGNWLLGVVTETHLAERPELRRYERQPI